MKEYSARKYLKKAHKFSNSGLSLKVWARSLNEDDNEFLYKCAQEWFLNKDR